ncbi:MAG: hypothetical protein WCY89_01735 [Flavobacteriaceae bacterium]
MTERIKLIWDFRGPDALHTAEHHQIHLDEYVAMEKVPDTVSGYEQLSEFHSIAFLTVNRENMIAVRDALKPHRGEVG